MILACILISHFPFRLEVGRKPSLDGEDVIIFEHVRGKRLVLDASPSLADVLPGTPLHHALSRHHAAQQLEADLSFYQQRFEQLLTRLQAVSPNVQEAEFGCAYLDLDGLDAMYGGRSGLHSALQQAVVAELEPRFGIGPGMFPAYVAALSANPGQVVTTPANLREFLAGRSLDILPLPWEKRTRLRKLGLTNLGDIARQQLGPIQAAFGKEGVRVWELTQGMDRRTLVPRRQDLKVSASMEFPTPTVAYETMLLAIEALLATVFAQPTVQGHVVRSAELSAAVFLRPAWRQRVTFKDAVGDPAHALPAFRNALTLHPPPGPLEDLTVTLGGITGESGRQGSLFPEIRRQEQLREVLRQLEVVMGERPPIYQIKDAQPWSRMPEERRVLVPPSFP